MPLTTTQQTARQKRERREILSDLLTARQAAKIKGCSENSIYKAIHAKRLPADRIGPVWMVSRQALDAWVLIGHRPRKTKGAIMKAKENEPHGIER